MPANAHYFLKEYLSLIRLSIGPLNKHLEIWQEQIGISNFDLVQEEHPFYSVLFNSCGYKHNFFRNLFLFMCMFAVMALVWLGVFIKEHVTKFFVTGQPRKKSHLPWISNFILRFLYEAFLEICICMMITAAAVEFNTFKAGFFWFSSVIILLLILALIVFVASRICLNGPFIKGCYTKQSLIKSFWQIRPVQKDILSEFYKEEEE